MLYPKNRNFHLLCQCMTPKGYYSILNTKKLLDLNVQNTSQFEITSQEKKFRLKIKQKMVLLTSGMFNSFYVSSLFSI